MGQKIGFAGSKGRSECPGGDTPWTQEDVESLVTENEINMSEN